MKKISFVIMVLASSSFLLGCNNEQYICIKLFSDNCELRKTPDSKGVDSIKFKKGSKNLDFYIYPTDDPTKHIYVDSITTGGVDFSEHYQNEEYHFTTDNTKITEDLIINAEATNMFVVTFHANDGIYSDGTVTRKVKDVRPGETFGEVVKRLSEKPIRSMMDMLEGWTDIDKFPILDSLKIEGDMTVFADYTAYPCYVLFNDLNEHIDQRNMLHYGDLTYTLFDPAYGFEFNFLFEDGYELSTDDLTVNDETMPERTIDYSIEGNRLSISSVDVSEHNLLISMPNASLSEYEVHKPVYSYLTIDDTGYEKPTIKTGYKATMTFESGYKIPDSDMLHVTVGGKVFNDFIWTKNQDGTVNFEIPAGQLNGDLSYLIPSYELKVAGSVINDINPSKKISGMVVTLSSNDESIPYIATTTTDEYGHYSFNYVEDTSYTISIDLTTGATQDEEWVSNEDTLTITPEEIRDGIKKDFYVANYADLDAQSLDIKINSTNYEHYDISAYGGKANAILSSDHSKYTIELKKEYNPNLLLECTHRQTDSHSIGILDRPTVVVPVDMSQVGSELDLSINAYKNYGQSSEHDPTVVCRNYEGGSLGCYLATSRKNDNFAFMIHSPSLKDGSIYRIAFTLDKTATSLDNRTFIISFTTEGKILSITDGNERSVKNPELIRIYSHEPEGVSLPAVEITTSTDFFRAQGIMITDTQDIYCTLQSERSGHYGEFVNSVLSNPSTYYALKADGTF